MACIIIIDMRDSNGTVIGIEDDNDCLTQFDTKEDAESFAKGHPLLRAFPYKIIDLD